MTGLNRDGVELGYWEARNRREDSATDARILVSIRPDRRLDMRMQYRTNQEKPWRFTRVGVCLYPDQVAELQEMLEIYWREIDRMEEPHADY